MARCCGKYTFRVHRLWWPTRPSFRKVHAQNLFGRYCHPPSVQYQAIPSLNLKLYLSGSPSENCLAQYRQTNLHVLQSVESPKPCITSKSRGAMTAESVGRSSAAHADLRRCVVFSCRSYRQKSNKSFYVDDISTKLCIMMKHSYTWYPKSPSAVVMPRRINCHELPRPQLIGEIMPLPKYPEPYNPINNRYPEVRIMYVSYGEPGGSNHAVFRVRRNHCSSGRPASH